MCRFTWIFSVHGSFVAALTFSALSDVEMNHVVALRSRKIEQLKLWSSGSNVSLAPSFWISKHFKMCFRSYSYRPEQPLKTGGGIAWQVFATGEP